jgi:Fe-S cluster biosynthesis and repair protein YggX
MTETSGPAPIRCARCGETSPPVENPPYPGALREELQARVCGNCWAEWLKVEVMVINELQLNFMEPRALDVLVSHMREFLLLDKPAESGE